MAKEKSLLQEAIAEAKQVRQAAIENAYRSLEENLTPSIKAMLENKLEEELNIEENDEESIEEVNANSGFKEVKAPKAKVNEEEENDQEEIPEDSEKDEEEAEKDSSEEVDSEPAEEDIDKAEDDAEAEEAADDDTKIEDLTVGDLKALISDMVAQIQATPAPEGNEGVDMEAADVEGQGEEDIPIEGDDDAAEEASDESNEEESSDDDDEINLAELLKELEQEENDNKPVEKKASREDMQRRFRIMRHKQLCESRRETKEALNIISELKNTISDVNLLNAKLIYTSRMLAGNLTESQKARVIGSFDKAKSSAEIKTIYKTLTESFEAEKKSVLKEHRGLASRSAGRSTAAPAKQSIVEVDPVVKRFQQLAGIID